MAISDCPPPYSLPALPYKSAPSLRTLDSNCVRSYSTLADSVDDLRSVPVDDLRPRAKDVQITLDAVDDIRFCENLFGKWMAELDKATSDSKKRDRREQTLRFYLGRLKERAALCSNRTNEILQYHIQFATLMARRIDDAASKSPYDSKYDGPEPAELASDIREASRLLSISVEQMKYELKSFVSALEKVPVTVEKERSLLERILRWLKSLFKAIATIFATLTPSTIRHHPDPKVRGCALANTTLGQAAAVFCTTDPEPKKGRVSESLDSVILFLKEIVPNEAENAQSKLKRLDKALDKMERMRAGQRMILSGPDPAAVAEEWRGVAGQYQSAIERKKS